MRRKVAIFTKQILKNQLEVSGVYTIHYFRYGKKFIYPEESHNFYELVYIDSGSAILKHDNEECVLRQGQAFIHTPNSKHTISTTHEFANSAIVTFDCKSKHLNSVSNKIIEFNGEQKQLLNHVIREAKEGYSDKLDDLSLTKMTKNKTVPFACDQIIKNCIELLLVSLIRREYSIELENKNVLTHQNSTLVKDVLSLLNEKLNQNENVSLEELSFKLGFSKSYLKNKFKMEIGESILQYYINMKIDKAKRLLGYSEKSITEISDALGFSSVQYFCRQFKIRTDMTPSEYVKSIKTDHLI